MDCHDMYHRNDAKPEMDLQTAVNRLQQICHLAKIGSASTESLMDIPDLNRAQDSLHEVIYRLASEALIASLTKNKTPCLRLAPPYWPLSLTWKSLS